MPIDDIFQTARRRDNDFGAFTQVELLLFYSTLKEKKERSACNSRKVKEWWLRTPPTIETHLYPSGVANFVASDSICCASSRVGARINAYGPKCLFSSLKGGNCPMKVNMGITKAAVLPEPVGDELGVHRRIEIDIPVSAIPIKSRFCKPIGMACRWMGEGSL
jgi:hypothetical protein